MSKIKNFLFLFFILFGLSFISLSEPSQAMDEDEAPYTIGRRGVTFYEAGEYDKASPLLHRALEDGDLTAALPYADICYRNLDKGKHPPREAALWYVRAAEAGDGEALSYLRSLSPIFLEEFPEAQKTQKLVHIWAHQDANTGYSHYAAGQFAEAAKHLKRASIGNHSFAQELYADICFRQLDLKPHSYLEAAMWYLLSAHGDDSQSFSYLKSIIPGILEDNHHEAQMKAIVGCWIMHETLPCLKPLQPDQVNNYLITQYKRKIDKTTAQKLPYLFERVTSAIMYNLTGRAHSVIEEQLFPQANAFEFSPEIRGCALTASTLVESKFIKPPMTACVYGPVYFNYFKSLDMKLDKGVLKEPASIASISPIYELLLDSLQEATKDKRAKDLSRLSHHDYPWLWAGVMFWKEKEKQPFNFTSLAEDELLKRLTEMSDRVPEHDVDLILKYIESEEVWPNDGKHPVCLEFNQRMRKYFISSMSREEEIVREIENHFYMRLREHTLDLSNQKDRQIMKTPFLMFYCRKLKLRNTPSTKQCYQILQDAQRYFMDVNLEIALSPNFNSESDIGKNITKLLNKIKKRGAYVTVTAN